MLPGQKKPKTNSKCHPLSSVTTAYIFRNENFAKKSQSSKSPPEKQADRSRCQKQDEIEVC